jgi:hypothetical protein
VSPWREKQLDRARQRRGFSEYRHALRHGKWARKRRAEQKAERGAVGRRLAAYRGRVEEERVHADLVLPTRRAVRKWGPSTLGDWIDSRLERRRAARDS